MFTSKLNRRSLFTASAAVVVGAAVAAAGIGPAMAQAVDSIPAAFPFTKRFVRVNGARMAYVDVGRGPVVLFIHGNPTSSYLWRNIIPHVSADHRAIAVDLIGMGDSDKPAIGYTFEEQAAYLDGFIRRLRLRNVTLVVHDWGSALGMRYARMNPRNVRGLAFMEALIPPTFPAASADALGPEYAQIMRAIRTPGVGEQMVLEQNFFVEQLLGRYGTVRPMSEAALAEYRRPFPTPQSRLPTLVWPRQLPIEGAPAASVAAITANGEWLSSTTIPKILFHATPGAVAPSPVVEIIRQSTQNLTVVDIGPGRHFVQEDNPRAIGEGLRTWLAANNL
jgi:haloalkane dehalogenase